jgi:tetrahydromethanopterin S-methyltransferase subunit E
LETSWCSASDAISSGFAFKSVVFLAYWSTCISFCQVSSLAAREPNCISIISLMCSLAVSYFMFHFICVGFSVGLHYGD